VARLDAASSPPFTLLQVDRTLFGDAGAQRSPRDRGLVPKSLALQLYDARESIEPSLVGRWQLFQELTATLSDIAGEGQFRPVYDRRTQEAELVLERGARRIPVHLLGSGVQQLVALVGQILMTQGRIVAVEEPELNLRFELQRRLADLFRRLVDDGRGPTQLLLTSHSPAFEGVGPFHQIRRGADGPIAVAMPSERAAEATELAVALGSAGQRAPLSYLTTDRVVRLSEEAARHLGLEHGGGVVVLREPDGSLRLMSNDAWLAAEGDGNG
jgi:hypothetical protein